MPQKSAIDATNFLPDRADRWWQDAVFIVFCLDHAVPTVSAGDYAIPFTSIIEQNAKVFQDILGRDQVLEHHSNYKESDDLEEAVYNRKRGMAAENWDAPVVVTRMCSCSSPVQ